MHNNRLTQLCTAYTTAADGSSLPIAVPPKGTERSPGLAMSLARAKNIAEIMELQAGYLRKQLSELAAQAVVLRSLSTKVAADVAAPLRTHV